MNLTRRFIFNGHASAISGRIVRAGEGKQARLLKDGFIDVPASALGPVGGRSTAIVAGGQIAGFLQFGGGSTSAEGVFDDLKAQFALTEGQGQEERLTTTTTVRAELRELAIGLRPQLTIERARASLVSTSPWGSAETPVRIGEDTTIEGVSIDGRFKLRIDLNLAPFRQHDTLSKLLAAADDPAFVRRHGQTLFMRTVFEGRQPPPPAGRLIRSYGGELIHGTIVKTIRWVGKPFPGARIDGNTLTIPDIGTLFFGEIMIERGRRRLTMVRGALGSPIGGSMCAGDVQDNGSWSI
jgi:hypothetical protein